MAGFYSLKDIQLFKARYEYDCAADQYILPSGIRVDGFELYLVEESIRKNSRKQVANKIKAQPFF